MQYLDLKVAGRLIQQMRLASSITQKNLAARSGISRATISALENGRLQDIGIKTLGALFGALPYTEQTRDVSESSRNLGAWLKEYREHVAAESVESFATRAGLIPERVRAMEEGDGTISINEWLTAFSCMQVLPDVMDAAKPALALLGSMFDAAKRGEGFHGHGE